MIKLFKKLFALLFLKKKSSITEKSHLEIFDGTAPVGTIEPIQSVSVPKLISQPIPKIKKEIIKPGMKNNRLHIEFNGASAHNGTNSYFDKIDKNGKLFRFFKAEKMYNGRIESMRCTKLYRAQEIVAQIQSYCIRRATFKDYQGIEHQIA